LTDADLDNITSKLEDGILEIVVVSKKTNKKTIEIK
jgi:HSP20 family molecular chaperone IbpA